MRPNKARKWWTACWVLPVLLSPLTAAEDPVLERDLLLGRFYEDPSHYTRNFWIRQPVFEKGNRGHEDHEAKENVYPSIHPGFYGEQVLDFGSVSTSLARSNLNASFFIGGARCYEVGTLRGAFIERGIVFGDEAGIWSQPFKILDGILIEASLDGEAFTVLNSATRAVNRMYCMDFHQEVGDLSFRRRDFPAGKEAAFFHQLEIHNTGSEARRVRLRITFQSNIRPIWHKPWFIEYGKDVIETAGPGLFTASDLHIQELTTAFGMAERETPPEQSIDTANPYRPRGILELEVALKPDDRETLTFASVQYDERKMRVAETEAGGAVPYLKDVLSRHSKILEARERTMREAVFGNTRFTCPDKLLQQAYYAAVYNIASLSADMRPYFEYPHLMTSPERGYQLLFGIDTLYASMGASAAGARDIIRSTLENHLAYAADADNKGIHFFVDHFGRHGNRGGRAQETSQFIGTFWEFIQLTGDLEFARKHYAQVKALFSAVESLDRNGDHWPDGMTFPSLTERAGTETMLSAAVRICWAAEAMAGLARALGFEDEGNSYAGKAAALRQAFNRQWWIEDRNLWAVGLVPGEDGPQPVFLEDVHARSLHYPQTYRVADSEKGIRALQEIDRTAVDAADGLNAPAVTVWQNSLLATGAFRYGQAELGYRLLKRAARNPIELDKMLGAFSTMNPPAWLPPDNENKIMYCWSAGPFLETVLYGLMGIQPDAPSHALSFTPRIPPDWEWAAVEAYRMGEHVLNFVLEGEVWKVTHREGPCPLTLHFGADSPPKEIAPGDSVAFPLIRETPDHHTP